MRTTIGPLLVLSLAIASACAQRADPAISWSARFGPIIGNDTIVGRAYWDRHVLLLSDAPALIGIDISSERADRRAVIDRGSDVLWGLARLDDGSLWTLAGQRALGRVEPDGRISTRIPLRSPHVGVFGAGGVLVYQVPDFLPPADALTAGPPGEDARRTWSGIRTRSYPMARASVAALNLVSCGATDTAEVPCWFPDEAAVTLVRKDGQSRTLALAGLPVVAPEILLTSENPARPIRDVFVAASRDLWVLGSGAAGPTRGPVFPGGWLLVRYDGDGKLVHRGTLRGGARLIVHASGDRALLLAGDGNVMEVRL